MAADPIIVRKSQIIERCVLRIREELGDAKSIEHLGQAQQDSVLLNLERAAQASIDLGMRVVRIKKLGIPTESRDAFRLLRAANLVDEELHKKMMAMVGFRNTAVHDYQGLNLTIIDAIVRGHLDDFLSFVAKVLPIQA